MRTAKVIVLPYDERWRDAFLKIEREIRDALGIKRSGSLSTASLEVLAIVAYNQPVTRVFVDTLNRLRKFSSILTLL